ncbi:MAG: geranylgeranylglyceryl/heptaprenylglyceryl phosphate synthase [Marinilabiliales bacterium]
MTTIYNYILDKSKTKKHINAVLLDPDNYNEEKLDYILNLAENNNVDFFLVGGSFVTTSLDNFIIKIKSKTNKNVILFPGSLLQLSKYADGILLLSLISGRNPEFLIGNHVIAAPFLSKSKIEVISTSYILISTGNVSSVEYISNTKPIPETKTDIILATAMAGEMLGHKMIYLEAGSGAQNPIDPKLIKRIKNTVNIPLIVGGGIKTEKQYNDALSAGADIIVLGNVLEKNPEFLNIII